jgi:hypothetical protein
LERRGASLQNSKGEGAASLEERKKDIRHQAAMLDTMPDDILEKIYFHTTTCDVCVARTSRTNVEIATQAMSEIEDREELYDLVHAAFKRLRQTDLGIAASNQNALEFFNGLVSEYFDSDYSESDEDEEDPEGDGEVDDESEDDGVVDVDSDDGEEKEVEEEEEEEGMEWLSEPDDSDYYSSDTDEVIERVMKPLGFVTKPPRSRD